MRKNIIFSISVLILVSLFCWLLVTKHHNETCKEIILKEELDSVCVYLKRKYGENFEYNILNYSKKDTFRVDFSMKHNSDIRFSVEYWLNKSQYRDDYIQNLLEFELKSIMLNNIKSLGIENSDIFIGPIQGPPFEVSERLYEYYCNLGYYPKLEHINGKEIFSYSKIYIKEKLSENEKKELQNLLFSLDLPVMNINFEYTF